MDQNPRSRATRIGAAASVAALMLTVALASLAHAGDWLESERSGAAPAANRSAVPWQHHSMNDAMRSKLTAAFAVATSRIEGSPECAALFAALDADGVEMLVGSLYFPAPPARRAGTCRQAVAYTFVGEAPTFLCSGFSAMTDDDASLVLVHEALHRAGLPESASQSGARSSAAVNDLVQVACGLNVAKKGGRAG